MGTLMFSDQSGTHIANITGASGDVVINGASFNALVAAVEALQSPPPPSATVRCRDVSLTGKNRLFVGGTSFDAYCSWINGKMATMVYRKVIATSATAAERSLESVNAVGTSFPTPYTTAVLTKFSDAIIASMRASPPTGVANTLFFRAYYGPSLLGQRWLPNACILDSTGNISPYAENGGTNPLARACGQTTTGGWTSSTYYSCSGLTTFTSNGQDGCHGGLGNWYQSASDALQSTPPFDFMWPSTHLGGDRDGLMSSEPTHAPGRYCVFTTSDGSSTQCDQEVSIEFYVY